MRNARGVVAHSIAHASVECGGDKASRDTALTVGNKQGRVRGTHRGRGDEILMITEETEDANADRGANGAEEDSKQRE